MADKVKQVDRGIPPVSRYHTFSSADAGTGDVLMIKESLGKSAGQVTIECYDADMRVRFNVYHTVFPRRPNPDAFITTQHLPNVGSGLQYKDESMGFVDIEASTTFTFDGTLPIDTIELVTVSGQFDIWAS